MAVVRFRSRLQEPRFGVCSTFLAELWPAGNGGADDNEKVLVWLRRGCLTMPSDPEAPLVMIGPGTGVAPFRSFVQTRQCMRSAQGLAFGGATLYFGCRHRQEDFLYAEEWQEHLARGNLQVLFQGPQSQLFRHPLSGGGFACRSYILHSPATKMQRFTCSISCRRSTQSCGMFFRLRTGGSLSRERQIKCQRPYVEFCA